MNAAGTSRNSRSASKRHRRLAWTRWSDERLLDVRMCDLKLQVTSSPINRNIKKLYTELDQKGLTGFRPHFWFSSEWFSPDGVPGIAIPFYLGHPRLTKLEADQMLEVEGGTDKECMRILRHEVGHCIDTSYRLHRKKHWREIFGPYGKPYPDSYKPKPGSRQYVTHLDWWYAQAHPAEDFAETFAVWLKPASRWRQAYKGWSAIRKLEYVDELMKDIAGTPPLVRSRRTIEPLWQINKTLRRHYREKKRRYADDWPDFYDSDLRKLFSDDRKYRNRPTAAGFLRRIRPELRDRVAEWTGTHSYTIDQVLRDMIDRCKELRLRMVRSERETRTEAMVMVTVQTMNFMLAGRYRVAL